MMQTNNKGELIVKWDDLPPEGDLMELSDFIELCRAGAFINYDGHGWYASETGKTNILVMPSDIINGNIREEFTHVLWLNR